MTIKYYWTVRLVAGSLDEYQDMMWRLPIGEPKHNWQIKKEDLKALTVTLEGYQESESV